MRENWKRLLLCILIPLAVGVLASILSSGGMKTFEGVMKPALSPPSWLFPVVWTMLYILMGISSYLVLMSGAEEEKIKKAFTLYGNQLLINFLWPTFFFSFQWYLFSFLWLLLLIGFVSAMIRSFYEVSKAAAYLNLPYLLWLLFAAYLNFAIWKLN